MGVTFIVDMSLIRSNVSLVVPHAFQGIHYLSMFGDINYTSALPESMQKLMSRWLYRHGFPRYNEMLCACIERKIIELSYFSADKLVLIEHEQHCSRVLEALSRLRCESWSLYDALVSRLTLVIYGANADLVPSAPVPIRVLPCWRQVHDSVAMFDLAINDAAFAPVAVPLLAEKAMCL